jgi:enoyl-CoA hydratase/carnithine racemase
MATLEESYQRFAIERHGPVTVLAFNRPEQRNKIDDRMHTELSTVFAAADHDPETLVAVLTGKGPAFMDGADRSASRSFSPGSPVSAFHEARLIIDTILNMTTPLIAAVNGDAHGLGAILASLTDSAFIERSARMGEPHVPYGVTAGNGAAALWPAIIGVNQAKRLIFGGEWLSAEESVQLGLAQHVVDDGASLDAALALAETWAAMPRFALTSSKRIVNMHLIAAAAHSMPTGLLLEEQSFATEDYRRILAEQRRAMEGP